MKNTGNCLVLNSGVVLVVGGHSSWYLQDGSLREVNVPFVRVSGPQAKNFDEGRRYRPTAAAVVAALILKLSVDYWIGGRTNRVVCKLHVEAKVCRERVILYPQT